MFWTSSHFFVYNFCFYSVRAWGSWKSESGRRLRLIPLRGSSQSNDEDDQEERKNSKSLSEEDADNKSLKWQASTSEQLDKVWQGLQEKLPLPLVNFVKAIVEKIFALRWQFVSFVAGAVLTVAAIIVPIYSQVETLSKPVTLFETILGDLEQAYVDPVDTDKLFETGMAAMLRYVMVSFFVPIGTRTMLRTHMRLSFLFLPFSCPL